MLRLISPRKQRDRLVVPIAGCGQHPRTAALNYLADTLTAGRLGVDPYDSSIVLLDVSENEALWGRIVVELTGLHLGMGDQPHGIRYRMILEADIRQELGLDQPDAPRIHEPLASRRADAGRRLDELTAHAEGLELLENPQTPVLRAIADARDAQRRAQERLG